MWWRSRELSVVDMDVRQRATGNVQRATSKNTAARTVNDWTGSVMQTSVEGARLEVVRFQLNVSAAAPHAAVY